jgi:hypothetical protein
MCAECAEGSFGSDHTCQQSTVALNFIFPHIRTMHLDITKVFYSPTDAPVSCLKNNIKIFYIKIAPTCFGAVTPSSGSALFALAKVTLVNIANYGTLVCD